MNAISEIANSEYGSYWLQSGKVKKLWAGHLLVHGISALASGPSGEYNGMLGGRAYSKDHDLRLPVLISRIAPFVLIITQLGLVYLDYRRGQTMKVTVTAIACAATAVAHEIEEQKHC